MFKISLVAFFLGAISGFSMAPFNYTLFLFITFPLMIYFLDGIYNYSHKKFIKSFFLFFFFGIGFYAISIFWLVTPFSYNEVVNIWLVPLIVFFLILFLSIFNGLVGLCSMYFWNKGFYRILIFSSFWIFFELVRSYILTGFPWNLISYTWSWNEEIMQITSFIGSYGLSFFTVLGCASLIYFKQFKKYLNLFPVFLIFTFYIFGYFFLQNKSNSFSEKIFVQIIQPNISQHIKNNVANQNTTINKLFLLSSDSYFSASDNLHDKKVLIIWPETAITSILDSQQEKNVEYFSSFLKENQLLVTGIPRLENNQFFNSLIVVDYQRRILANYDKYHLVPFGEYIPLASFFSFVGIEKYFDKFSQFSSGNNRRNISLKGIPSFRSLICYEVIFPWEIISKNDTRPSFIINITNDAWFGDISGPYQHLVATRFRSVEFGLPILRSANTGISAIIDPYGRLINFIKLNETGVISSPLPKATGRTFYSRFGDYPLAIFLFIILFFGFFSRNNYHNR